MNASLFKRDCGILMHPTSLPNDFGVGDFGPSAHQWLDLLAKAKQNIWQILPLNPAGYGDSPYQGLSAFATNPVFLSPDDLHQNGLLLDHELFALQVRGDSAVDYPRVYENKAECSVRAAHRFYQLEAEHPLQQEFARFIEREADWVHDFALYAALKNRFANTAWTTWPAPYRDRHADALESAKLELKNDIARVRFEQFFLRRQWDSLRAHARELGIRIVGDLPIFVAHDSADVWCRRDLFRLNADGSPSVVAGVPPDYFSATGQRWGNPLYDWEAHAADGYAWWRARMWKILNWVDVVRIDHFRGFEAFWEIPGDAPTAENGQWVKAPGREVFGKFVEDFGKPLPVIAEDLGVITEAVVQLREDFDLPGIRIEQFAFGSDPMKHTFLPDSYRANCVAYTGTHDNDTVVGWFNETANESSTRSEAELAAERANVLEYFGTDGSEIHLSFVRSLYLSDAGAAVIPLQDLLGLGTDARMNTPGTESGNWGWRLLNFDSLREPFNYLSELTVDSGRGLTWSAPTRSAQQ